MVGRSIARIKRNRNRRPAKDYECRVRSSEATTDLAAIRLMIDRLTLA